VAKGKAPKPSADEEERESPAESESEHRGIESVFQLPRGNRSEKTERKNEGEHRSQSAAVDVERISRDLHDGVTEHPEVVYSHEPNARRHEDEIERIKDDGRREDKNRVRHPLKCARVDMGGHNSHANHHEPSEKRPDLIEVEFPCGDPELSVDRLGENEVESPLANLFRDFVKRHEERLEDRVHEEARGGEDERIAATPSCNRIGLAIHHKENEDKETEPNDVLADLGDEVRSELQLTRKRTDEERSVDLPVALHGESLQRAS